VLEANSDRIKWARTDRNGQTTFTFTDAEPTIVVAQGEINDPRPNADLV
jgi:beta-lactamase superfamily II metal-dependent hydrolase